MLRARLNPESNGCPSEYDGEEGWREGAVQPPFLAALNLELVGGRQHSNRIEGTWMRKVTALSNQNRLVSLRGFRVYPIIPRRMTKIRQYHSTVGRPRVKRVSPQNTHLRLMNGATVLSDASKPFLR
jgi:hypothetical protein